MKRAYILLFSIITGVSAQNPAPFRFYQVPDEPSRCAIVMQDENSLDDVLAKDFKVADSELNQHFLTIHWASGNAAVVIAVNAPDSLITTIAVSGNHVDVQLENRSINQHFSEDAVHRTEVDVVEVPRGQLTATASCALTKSPASVSAVPPTGEVCAGRDVAPQCQCQGACIELGAELQCRLVRIWAKS